MSLVKNFQLFGNSLTELERDCFQQLLAFQDLNPRLTISSLAETLNVSTTTIFRMVKKLNYKTFMEFRYDLLYQRHENYHYHAQEESVCDLMEQEIRNTFEMLRHVNCDEAVKKIIQAKNVLICASGMNNYVAKILAVKLSLYGIRTIYPDDQWFLYLEANNLTKDDFVIVLSRAGTTERIVDVMKNVKVCGCQILLITETKTSPMSQLADYVINVTLCEDEGHNLDSRLHIHLAIEFLLRQIMNQILKQRNDS